MARELFRSQGRHQVGLTNALSTQEKYDRQCQPSHEGGSDKQRRVDSRFDIVNLAECELRERSNRDTENCGQY